MTGDRARGLLIYGFAAVLLAAGSLWWSQRPVDTRLEQRLLPESEVLLLPPGADHQVVAAAGGGEYTVWMVCTGGAGSRVRVSMGSAADDSGRGLDCAGEPAHFTVSVGGRLRMNVRVGDAGPVVFRYAVVRPDG